MANSSNQAPVTVEELSSSLAQTDALAKLLIEKGIITEQEFLIAVERVDISNDAKADITLTQITDIEYPQGCELR
jgi:hypothetical protein